MNGTRIVRPGQRKTFPNFGDGVWTKTRPYRILYDAEAIPNISLTGVGPDQIVERETRRRT